MFIDYMVEQKAQEEHNERKEEKETKEDEKTIAKNLAFDNYDYNCNSFLDY